MKRLHKAILNLSKLEGRITPSLSTTLTWQGDISNQWGGGTSGTNTNWSSTPTPNKLPADGAVLVFPNAPAGNLTNNNNLSDLDLKSLSFTGTGYDITGNAITLSGGITANVPAAGTDSFHPTITLKADQTFSSTSAAGAVFNFDTIDLGGKSLTVDGAFTVNLGVTSGTKVTGAGGLIKTGTGTLHFPRDNDFTGPVQVNAGVLSVQTVSGLGAAGAGNATTVASGATLQLESNGTVAEDLTLSGTGAVGRPGALEVGQAPFFFTVNHTGALRLGGDATIGVDINATLILAGPVGAADDALGIVTVACPTAVNFAFANTATFTTELAGLTPGASGHDQLKVIGTVDLGGAALNVVPSFTPAIGAKFVIVDNDGADPITGAFNGLAEGATVSAGGVNFTISYKGIDGATGNDVVLTVASFSQTPGTVTLSKGGKTATFLDVDGDLVTVNTTKGPFSQADFKLAVAGVGGQLQLLNLTTHAADFTGANLTITAKPGPLGGNGFVNVGYINATGIDLGVVKIAGDLGRINAGTVGGDAKVPALKALAVQSIGLLGTSTQASNGTLSSNIAGALGALTVKGDVRNADISISDSNGRLGSATIGGSLVGAALTTTDSIGAMKIAGDIRADAHVQIRSQLGSLGAVSVGGSIYGDGGTEIAAFGQSVAPARGVDLAVKSLTVKGSVENFVLFGGVKVAGFGLSGNADASVGSITIGGDWIASIALIGVSLGPDFRVGTDDDSKPAIERDNADIVSSIGSFTVKGQALGTATSNNDMFGVVAERIGTAKIGGRTFAFNPDTADCFFAAPTLFGAGAESPLFDFTIRELGSVTPTPAFGGSNIVLSADKRTATFTDVDGDLATVTRSTGTFLAGDFTIATAASGGGQLRKLLITAAPGNLTITAKPGPDGGNGMVNVGTIDADGFDLGTVVIAGELEAFIAGDTDPVKPGTGSLTVQSIGQLAGTSGSGNNILSHNGIGKIAVTTDVRGAQIVTDSGSIGTLGIGGALSGGCTIRSVTDLGTLKTGGSVSDNTHITAGGRIGSITIGGDLIGTGNGNPTIAAHGQSAGPAQGLDFAIRNLTVKGNIEDALLELGFGTNADVSIGSINVGRAWLASTVQAGTKVGTDGFLGTSDDAKTSDAGHLIDVAGRFSTIASITIKGQALGSTTAGDSFGIVAEQILRAKIGARTLKFTKGERSATDAFAIGVTGPGPAPDNALSDFFIREITV
jgi:autotransporter-associated beta strand protein